MWFGHVKIKLKDTLVQKVGQMEDSVTKKGSAKP